MPNLATILRHERRAAPPVNVGARSAPLTIDDYAAMMGEVLNGFNAAGTPIQQTWNNEPIEKVGTAMADLARQAYKGNGLAFAVMAVRMTSFSLVRFSYQRMRNGRPTDLYGTPALMPLEVPWPGGTTQDLLLRMMLDVDLAGNSYTVRDGPWLMRLRPDWVQILLEPVVMNGGIVGYRKVGYTFHNGGIEVCPPSQIALFPASEVAHFAPTPDPDATFRGQSWLNAVTKEVGNDKIMERHKERFFENAATPNLTVSMAKEVSSEEFAKFKALMDDEHTGADNAYKTLYLGGGADVKVVGANFQQLEMGSLQGRGETRVAAAGGVPPIIVGLSEGLSSSTYSNYGQAMRRFADITMASLWGNAAGSLATIMRPPDGGSRLWYDTRDVAFLREDRTAAADVQSKQAQTIRTLLDAGYEPDSVVAAVNAEDFTLLVHSGLYSVQLQTPGSGTNSTTGTDGATPPANAPAADTAPADATNAAVVDAVARATRQRIVIDHRAPVDTTDRTLAADGQIAVDGYDHELKGATP